MGLDGLSASTTAAVLRLSIQRRGNSPLEKPLSASQKVARAAGGSESRRSRSSASPGGSALVFSMQQGQFSSNVMSAVNRAGQRLNELQSQKSYTVQQREVEIITVVRSTKPVDSGDTVVVNPDDTVLPVSSGGNPSVQPTPVVNPPATGSSSNNPNLPPVTMPGTNGGTPGTPVDAADDDSEGNIKHHGKGYYKNHEVDTTDKGKGHKKDQSDDDPIVTVVHTATSGNSGGHVSVPAAPDSSTPVTIGVAGSGSANVLITTATTSAASPAGKNTARKLSSASMANVVETRRTRQTIHTTVESASYEERTLTRHLEIFSAVLSSGVLNSAMPTMPLDLYLSAERKIEPAEKSAFTVSESA